MPDEESIDAILQEMLEDGFQKAKGYSRIPIPTENNLSQFDGNTRVIVSEFLRRILDGGDSYKHHKDLDYHALHSLQLDLLSHIIYCERTIQSLQVRYRKSERVEMLKQRRRLLKLLGSTIAWLLLEFDAAYIRAFSKSDDPGFIVGKKGSLAEVMFFVAGHVLNDRTLLLHYITDCLRVGDLTLVEGSHHFPIEIKMDSSEKKHRLGRRERRQKQRGELLMEYFATKHSTKLVQGLTNIRIDVKKKESHHWEVLSEAFLEAKKKGHSLKFAEEGIAYGVCQNYKQVDVLVLNLMKSWSKPVLLFGDLYDHVNGLHEIMPFTLYEIPFDMKKEILFSDIFAYGFVDMKGVCNSMIKLGTDASWEDNRIKYKAHGFNFELVAGSNLLNRLRYECLSTQTLNDYALAPLPKLLKMSIEDNERSLNKIQPN